MIPAQLAEAASHSTRAYYDECAARINRDEIPLQPTVHLEAFISRLRPMSVVLDIGCGTGRAIPSIRGRVRQLKVIGIDNSKSMLHYAKDRYPDIDFRLGDARDVRALVSEVCDGFLCIDTLSHIPRAQLVSTLQNIRAVLRRGAVGYMTVPLGTKTQISHRASAHPPPHSPNYQILIEEWTSERLSPCLAQAGLQPILPISKKDSTLRLNVEAV